MDAKEYLGQLEIIDTKILHKEEERESLYSIIEGQGMKYDSVKVQTSPSNSQERLVCKCMDLTEEIDADIEKYIEIRDKIIDQIHELKDNRYVKILYWHYVPMNHRTKRLEEISCIMRKRNGSLYNYEYVNKLHKKALKSFEKKFQNIL